MNTNTLAALLGLGLLLSLGGLVFMMGTEAKRAQLRALMICVVKRKMDARIYLTKIRPAGCLFSRTVKVELSIDGGLITIWRKE